MTIEHKVVTVVGAGKVGAPLAALLASAGHEVYAADVNEAAVAKINQNLAPVDETGLQDLFTQCGSRIVGTSDIAGAVEQSDFVFVVVPTPSEPDGSYSLKYIDQALVPIAKALQKHIGWLTVVIVSTVSPGATAGHIVPELEKLSGEHCGESFHVCYNPEFIALGSVLVDLKNPSFLLIGSQNQIGGHRLEMFYHDLYHTLDLPVPPVAHMNLVNAEISKISLNCYVTTKISYANALAELCENIPGADARIVCKTVGLDRRIGSLYLRPGTAYAGPCFPRDGRAMIALGDMPLARATDEINRRQTDRLTKYIPRVDGEPSKVKACNVAILGLAYKTDTAITEESAGMSLFGRLKELRVVDLFVHDPAAAPSEGWRVKIREADVVYITTPWPEYRTLAPEDFKPTAKIIDCWGILNEKRFAGRDLVVIGRGPAV